MTEKDIVLKELLSDSERFAVFACDNQTSIHYAMPIRLMLYDALTYTEQVKDIERTHRLNKDLQGSSEFLSGFKPSDSVIPVVSLVVYYGKDDWDGSVDLFSMLNISGKSKTLKKYMSNYKLNIFSVCKAKDLELFSSDLKEFFGILKYSSNKKQMKEYVTANIENYSNIDKVLYNAISIFLDDNNYLKRNEEKFVNENGGINMCLAFEQMIEEGIDIGIDQTLTVISMFKEEKNINEIHSKTGLALVQIRNLYNAIKDLLNPNYIL